MKNKIIKRIIIILGILVGVAGLTMVSVQTTSRVIENMKAKKMEKAKEKKIREEKEADQERKKIALWVVQHFSGKEPIKNIKVGRVNTNGIFGSAGKSTSLIINNKNGNRLEGIKLDEDGVPNGSYIWFDGFRYTYHEKKDSRVTLKGVKVEKWKNN
ncbi:hypothetical protein [Lactobacillus sp. PV034]|uniref:hypothetical protein n=1 Tax=Lactobacillus sp. PV034 TaxID=2594495 RepID=UPI00223FA162|nr:hypothetical protein [Lactobacillus sp. PV034]QNQ80155.1 hypothetical protein FP432_00600 [Lactobacillus sp. PV034]